MGEPAPLAHQSAPASRPATSRSPLSSASSSSPAAALGTLPTERLAALNQRHDRPGLLQLALHLGVLVAGGLLWGQALGQGPLAGSLLGWSLVPAPLVPAPMVPAPLVAPLGLIGLLLLGWGLAFAFCAMHEAGHRTAFASRSLNDAVAWWAGVLSFYNADFYRRYHQWHHRYTHLVGLDPELEDSPPTTRVAYLLELSGIPWWMGKVRGHLAGLRGDFSTRPYIPADAVPAVRRSLGLQFAVYGLLALASLIGANGFLFWYWLLPLAVGQPLLRFVLLAEHGGCPFVADGLRNTRTTHTLAPLRRLMWNMPFHAEHHLYPSLPFHALAAAHHDLRPGLTVVAPGYLAVHRGFLANLAALAMPAAVAAGQSDAVPASLRS
jgi:fatty acid desaturase